MIAKKRVTIVQENGDTLDVVLKDYKYLPILRENLLSVLKLTNGSWDIGNKGGEMFVKEEKHKIRFDKNIWTKTGWLTGVIIKPKALQQEILNNSVAHIHALFEHPPFDTTKKTAHAYETTSIGEMDT